MTGQFLVENVVEVPARKCHGHNTFRPGSLGHGTSLVSAEFLPLR